MHYILSCFALALSTTFFTLTHALHSLMCHINSCSTLVNTPHSYIPNSHSALMVYMPHMVHTHIPHTDFSYTLHTCFSPTLHTYALRTTVHMLQLSPEHEGAWLLSIRSMYTTSAIVPHPQKLLLLYTIFTPMYSISIFHNPANVITLYTS